MGQGAGSAGGVRLFIELVFVPYLAHQKHPCRDPTLTSEYIKHFSSGIQHGDGRHNASELQIMSTCKHFFGYDIEFRESRPLDPSCARCSLAQPERATAYS